MNNLCIDEEQFNSWGSVTCIGIGVAPWCDGSVCCSTTTDPFDTDKMAVDFLMQFVQQTFTVGQPLVYSFNDKKLLQLVVKELEGITLGFL